MCSMIKKEQQNFYTVNVIETKMSDYKRLSKSANFELDSCWKGKKPMRNELNSNKLSLRIAEKALGYGFSGLDRK